MSNTGKQITTKRGTIREVTRLRNSTSGNPKWRVRLADGGVFETGTDYGVGHLLGTGWEWAPVLLTLDVTGRITHAEWVPCLICGERIRHVPDNRLGSGVIWAHRLGQAECGTGDGSMASPDWIGVGQKNGGRA